MICIALGSLVNTKSSLKTRYILTCNSVVVKITVTERSANPFLVTGLCDIIQKWAAGPLAVLHSNWNVEADHVPRT